ncbi:MAG TPA: RsmG family class I SAM-dependent methyltransferase [Balneolaceae bacterium]|nr:RsmG family class I SAM-dependent methyltransferase [Balneolaceae bacterium]
MKHTVESVELKDDFLAEVKSLYQSKKEEHQKYLDELFDWNEKINLVSRTVSRETVENHIVHSLFPSQMGLMDAHDKWIDAGSGGGLPGIPLAIQNPEKQFLLNDNVRKKMKAVSAIVDSLELTNVEIVAKSISLFDLQSGTGIVTKHAFKIPKLLHLLDKKPWKSIILWKGERDVLPELNKTPGQLNVTIYPFRFSDTFFEGKALVRLQKK